MEISSVGIIRNLLTVLFSMLSVFFVNGQKVTKECEYFSKIRLHSAVNVSCVVSNDSIPKVYYFNKSNTPDPIILRVEKGILTIQTLDIPEAELPDTVFVHFPKLIAVENCYDASLNVKSVECDDEFKITSQGNGIISIGNIKAPKVKSSIVTGHGSIIITGGWCESLNCSLVGTGNMELFGLSADVVSIKCYGTGKIQCVANRSLSVRGVGSTSVYYIGAPKIKKRGSIKLYKTDMFDETM